MSNAHTLRFYVSKENAVVYHSGSGNAHILNQLSYNILQYINNSDNTSSHQIMEFILSDLDSNVDPDEFFQYVSKVLNEFYALGLIEKL